MALTNSLVMLFIAVHLQIYILTKLLQQCFLFFIVVVILGHDLGNSQVSVYGTISPTLVTEIRGLTCICLTFICTSVHCTYIYCTNRLFCKCIYDITLMPGQEIKWILGH